MLKRMNLSLLLIILLATCVCAASAPAQAARFSTRAVSLRVDAVNDKEQDGLVGSVRRVKTETAKLVSKEGKLAEGPRVVLETATYDIKGTKIDNAYFLAAGGSLTGKEIYKYDDKGNIIEMSLHRDDGSLASKEVYTYEFDAMGNWTKMTTAVAILEGGKVTFEPTEVTYRSIAYYMEEATVSKLSQPASFDKSAQPATNAATPANVRTASSSSANAPVGGAMPAPSSAGQSPTSAAQSNAANQSSTASASKANTFVPVAAATKNAPVASKKASAVNAPPELASVDNSKVYTVSNPAVGNVANAAASKAEPGGANSEPQVKVEGEAPARPLARGPLKPISGGVLNGKARSLPPPVYPVTAKRFRVAGVVTVEVVIDLTGKVISAKATDGPEMLYQAAEKAAMQAQFSPTLLSGQPVKISGVINYNFSLGN